MRKLIYLLLPCIVLAQTAPASRRAAKNGAQAAQEPRPGL